MSHHAQMFFCKQLKNKFPDYFKNKSVLEVGSLYVNGTVRDLFENCNYTGVDLFAGKCVDVVGHLVDLKLANTYDVVCSTEAFEHDSRWMKTLNEMYKLLNPNGLLFFTCAGFGRPEHGTPKANPNDSGTGMIGDPYYKNLTITDFMHVLDFDTYFSVYGFEIERVHKDVYGFGIKR